MRRRTFAVAAVLAAASRTAHADPPPQPQPDVEASPPVREAPGSVKLFDTFRSIPSYQLDIGPDWTRRASETTPLSRRTDFQHRAPAAGEITIGSISTTPSVRGPLYLASEQGSSLRVLDSKSVSWAVITQRAGGGIALGPLEIEAKLGVSFFSVDIIHAQPSLQFFSPRIEAGAGLHLGKIRLDFKIHSEYLWRWFGPDYFIRGFTIGLRVDQPSPKNPFEAAPPAP